LLLPWKESVVALVVLFAVFYLFRFYINKKLGGYTGDILGALQQLSEVFFYLALLGVQNF
jgi:adenosylcobinamide-GDP ribazoletransferase